MLGVAGKMGPTLAWMARRAADRAGTPRRVIGVARFSEPDLQPWLESARHRDDSLRPARRTAVTALPDAPLVVYMAGRKFGSTGDESLTWAMNAAVPVLVCERYGSSRIAAFSTGNVYGLTPVARGGSREPDVPSPVGEYAMSCLARERIFEHFSRTRGTPVALLRLNYATEMRYGLLVDLARRVAAGAPIDLTMGHVNVIWQGDANAMAIAALEYAATPARPVNIAGPGPLSVRELASALAARLGIRGVVHGARGAGRPAEQRRPWLGRARAAADRPRSADRLDGGLGRSRRRLARQAHALRVPRRRF